MKWLQQFELIKKEFSDSQREKATNASIASYFGVSLGKVQAWKRGQRPSADDLEVISRKLGLSPEWLLLGEGEIRRSASYTREDGMLVGEASKAARHLGPVAERVDGIERAAPGTPLVDMLPFVIKNLRSWYHTVSAAMPDSRALEPEGPTYAQETNQPNGPPRLPGDKHTRD
ncbi:helix-turn-helix domain-containing protein [Pseudodesulfovibrio karagichevae]|uniref:Helix-turn-helix domain-containing protein n=1 Tax=Pseudodesulfovibrio karagichevae TaxID=3239305 RepID=A0ABV4K271_9BACT